MGEIVLKIFMDETGTHDDATMVAVGGYISQPKHWRAWTKDWDAQKRKVPSGRRPIKVFHSTDCANFRGEFEGWEKERRDQYGKDNMPELIRRLKTFRQKLLAQGWDGKAE